MRCRRGDQIHNSTPHTNYGLSVRLRTHSAALPSSFAYENRTRSRRLIWRRRAAYTATDVIQPEGKGQATRRDYASRRPVSRPGRLRGWGCSRSYETCCDNGCVSADDRRGCRSKTDRRGMSLTRFALHGAKYDANLLDRTCAVGRLPKRRNGEPRETKTRATASRLSARFFVASPYFALLHNNVPQHMALMHIAHLERQMPYR